MGLLDRIRGGGEEDAWGYDAGYAARVQPIFDGLYDQWWRVRASGGEHVPRAAGKPWADRYRLLRFGRGGFAATAIRAGVPIIPCGIVGGEEAYPRLGQVPALARLTRLPVFPLTLTFPLLGPLGLVPLPAKWRIQIGEPVPTAELGFSAAEDRAVVLALAEAVRTRVQDLVHEQLTQRAGAFF